MNNKTVTPIFAAQRLNVSFDSAPILMKGASSIWFHTFVDNGSGGVPTDTPLGKFLLWSSTDGVKWSSVIDSGSLTEITDELAKIKPSGNSLIAGTAMFEDFGGIYAKISFVYTSGAGTNSVVNMDAVVFG